MEVVGRLQALVTEVEDQRQQNELKAERRNFTPDPDKMTPARRALYDAFHNKKIKVELTRKA